MDLVLVPKRGLTDPQDPVPLRPEGTITIGRAGALKVHDELVSIHHAQVFFDPAAERYVIRDLDSSSGTIVDGECIRNEVRPLRDGTELRFGNTVIEVQRARRSPVRLALVGCGSLLLLVLLVLLGATVLSRGCSATDSVKLQSDTDVWGLGEGSTSVIEVPPRWLRRHGHPWDVRLLEVTDHDSNGVSELWLRIADKNLAIVTFGEGGEWIDLGLLPIRYRTPDTGHRFPILEAEGETWQMDPALGRYRPVKQDGVVVWYRPGKQPAAKAGKGDKAKAEPHPLPAPDGEEPQPPSGFGNPFAAPKGLKVARVPVKDAERLGQFFVDRGIYGKVHYLICEGAFEGIRAQALTSKGYLEIPSPGCIEELRLDANPNSKIVGKPFAIALTPAGRRALKDDVLTFYSGDPSGLFLSADDAAKVEVLSQEPGPEYANTRLLAGDGRVVVPDPFPPGDAQLEAAPRLLESSGRRYSPSPPARTVTVDGPGEVELDLVDLYGPGQSRPEKFRVRVDEALGVTVEEVSTGVPRVVNLSPAGDGTFEDLHVRVRIDWYTWLNDKQVQRIRVGVRPKR